MRQNTFSRLVHPLRWKAQAEIERRERPLCFSFVSRCIAFFNRILVYAIREAATTNLKKLVEQFGQDWAAVSIRQATNLTSVVFVKESQIHGHPILFQKSFVYRCILDSSNPKDPCYGP